MEGVLEARNSHWRREDHEIEPLLQDAFSAGFCAKARIARGPPHAGFPKVRGCRPVRQLIYRPLPVDQLVQGNEPFRSIGNRHNAQITPVCSSFDKNLASIRDCSTLLKLSDSPPSINGVLGKHGRIVDDPTNVKSPYR